MHKSKKKLKFCLFLTKKKIVHQEVWYVFTEASFIIIDLF